MLKYMVLWVLFLVVCVWVGKTAGQAFINHSDRQCMAEGYSAWECGVNGAKPPWEDDHAD